MGGSMNIREWIAEHNEEAMMADGFEDAIIGICGRFGANPVVAYAEAEEYFEFNVAGAYVGENTPVFVTFYNPGTN